METQDITAVLPSGKQQAVTLAVSAKVQELKEILQRCFDQQFLVILDARGAVLRVDGMIPSAASVTCVARSLVSLQPGKPLLCGVTMTV